MSTDLPSSSPQYKSPSPSSHASSSKYPHLPIHHLPHHHQPQPQPHSYTPFTPLSSLPIALEFASKGLEQIEVLEYPGSGGTTPGGFGGGYGGGGSGCVSGRGNFEGVVGLDDDGSGIRGDDLSMRLSSVGSGTGTGTGKGHGHGHGQSSSVSGSIGVGVGTGTISNSSRREREQWVSGRAIFTGVKPGWPILRGLNVKSRGNGLGGGGSGGGGEGGGLDDSGILGRGSDSRSSSPVVGKAGDVEMERFRSGSVSGGSGSGAGSGSGSGIGFRGGRKQEGREGKGTGQERNDVVLPMRVTFRVALVTSRPAMESFQRARKIHNLLSADLPPESSPSSTDLNTSRIQSDHLSVNAFDPSPSSSSPSSSKEEDDSDLHSHLRRFLAFWDSPREGLWAIAEDRGAELLGSVGARMLFQNVEVDHEDGRKPPIGWTGSGEVGGFWERRVRPGIMQSERRWRKRTRSIAQAEREGGVDLALDGMATSTSELVENDDEGDKRSEVKKQHSEDRLTRRARDEMDQECLVVAEKAQEDYKNQYHDNPSLETGYSSTAPDSQPALSSPLEIDDEDDPTATVEQGYTAAVRVLIELANILQGLHDRRLALVICRPEFFLVEEDSTSTTTPPPCKIILSKISTMLEMSGSTPRPNDQTQYFSQSARSSSSGQLYPVVGLDNTSPDSPRDAVNASGLDSVYPEEVIRAHLRYIAPEALSLTKATGHLADIFSWGIAAYELISGRMIEGEAGTSEDLLADFHRHWTRQVKPITTFLPSIPQELCDVVKKAKSLDAEERYSCVAALIYDLRQVEKICTGQMSKSERQRFVPGQVDGFSRFQLPHRVVQRDQELDQIEKIWSRVRGSGNSEVVCVYGKSGEGKSKIVESFARRRDITSNVLVGWAKADQHLLKPLNVLIQLLESLLDRIFSDPNEDKPAWIKRLRGAVPGDARLIFSLLSRHWREVILGSSAPASATQDADWSSFARSFALGAINLLSLFASVERPLILVADDIQWQSSEETQLWLEIMESSRFKHTLLLSSLRTTTDGTPALSYRRLTLIRAIPLTLDSISHVLAQCFQVSDIEVRITPWSFLSNFVMTATAGNPFYVAVLISTLVRDGAIRFDFEIAKWDLNLAALPTYAVEGVEAFTAQVLRTISLEGRAILCLLACLPSRGISLELLAKLSKKPLPNVRQLVYEASTLGVVKLNGAVVAFTHDRNHAAALHLIDEKDLPPLYSDIASQLESESAEDYLFLRADLSLAVYDRGYAGSSKEALCNLVLAAASRAVRSASFTLAERYLVRARSLLDINSSDLWRDHHGLAMEKLRVEAEVCACLRQPQSIIPKLQKALIFVRGRAHKIELLTLLFRALLAMLELPQALDCVTQAFKEAGISLNPTDLYAHDLPESPMELFSRIEESRQITADFLPEDEVAMQLTHLMHYAGPTLYIVTPELGRTVFHATLVEILRRPRILHTHHSSYPLSLQAVYQADSLNWDMARAYLQASKDTWRDRAEIPALHIIWCSLAYLEVRHLGQVDYRASYRMAAESAQDAMLIYTGGLGLATARLGGRSLLHSLEEGLSVSKVVAKTVPTAQRLVLGSSLQMLANLTSKKGSLASLQSLDGQYLTSMDIATYLAQSPGFYALNHWCCAFLLGICLEAPPDTMDAYAAEMMKVESGGLGLVMALEFCLLLSAYELMRDEPRQTLIYRGQSMFLRTISMLESFPQNEDFAAHRLGLLALRELQKLRRGSRTFPQVMPVVDNAIDQAQAVGNHLLAGLLSRQAASSYKNVGPRLVKGYVIEAFNAFKQCEAYAAARAIADKYPDTVSVNNAWTSASDLRGETAGGIARTEATPSTPSTEADTVPTLDDGAASATVVKEITTRERLSLESILRSFLILASERNSDKLVQKVCEVLMMINRSDSACLALQDPATQEIHLRGIGSPKDFQTYDVPIHKAAALCPSCVILHASHLNKPKVLDANHRVVEREPYFQNHPPKSVLMVPLLIQGSYRGCIMLTSKFGANSAAHAQISLLGTFAAIVLESHSTTASLERAVQARTEEYQIANAHKSEFLNGVSHELRTPLHSIAGLAVIMANSSDLPPSQMENLQLILQASDDLLRVITQTLDHSRLESKSLQVEARPFSLRETVEASLDAIAHLAHAKNLDLILETTVENDPARTIGDAHRLRQCLLNLLSNAIKFCDKGCIRVRWEILKVVDSAIKIRLDVQDTGLGIPEAKVPKLFQSFSQVDSSISRKFGGSGLGLVIVKGLANLMGGDAWLAESRAGKGSTFSMTFEVRRETDGPVTAQPYKLPGPQRRAIVLSPNDLEATAGNLRAFGVETRIVSSPQAFLLDTEPVDFVFLDVKALDLDESALENLRRKRPNAKLLFLVALFDMTATIERLGMGHAEVITLPAKATSLLHAVQDPNATVPDAFKQTGKKASMIDKDMAKKCPMRILFVDDSLVNLGVGVKILNKFGYSNVHTASNGQIAVDVAKSRPLDLIFMDLQMPVMDGYSATEIITAEKSPETPLVVALTANNINDPETKARCVATGFTFYLNKPLLVQNLAQTLTQAYEMKFGGEGNAVGA